MSHKKESREQRIKKNDQLCILKCFYYEKFREIKKGGKKSSGNNFHPMQEASNVLNLRAHKEEKMKRKRRGQKKRMEKINIPKHINHITDLSSINVSISLMHFY